jgi:hypothetical protein
MESGSFDKELKELGLVVVSWREVVEGRKFGVV